MKIHCLRNPSSAGYEKAGAPSAKTTLRPCLRRYFSLPLSSRPFPPPSPPTAVPFHHHASRFPPQPVSCDTFISCIQQFRASSSNLAGLRPSFRGRSSLRFPSKKSFLHFLIFFLPLSLLLLFFFFHRRYWNLICARDESWNHVIATRFSFFRGGRENSGSIVSWHILTRWKRTPDNLNSSI